MEKYHEALYRKEQEEVDSLEKKIEELERLNQTGEKKMNEIMENEITDIKKKIFNWKRVREKIDDKREIYKKE